MVNLVLSICICFMVVKCTVDNWNSNSEPVIYKCIKGKTYFKEGEAFIESHKYKGKKCEN